MPARNLYHEAVVAALTSDGWTITDDPLSVKVGDRDLHIDLGAERPRSCRIAVTPCVGGSLRRRLCG